MRVDDLIRAAIDHLEVVLAEVRGIDEVGAAAGPGPVRHDAVQRHDLVALRRRGVEVVDAHGLVDEDVVELRRRGGKGDEAGHHECSEIHGADCMQTF